MSDTLNLGWLLFLSRVSRGGRTRLALDCLLHKKLEIKSWVNKSSFYPVWSFSPQLQATSCPYYIHMAWLAAVLPGNTGSSELMYSLIFCITFSGSHPLWHDDTTIILQHIACTHTSVDLPPLLLLSSPNWSAFPSTATTAAVFHQGIYMCLCTAPIA